MTNHERDETHEKVWKVGHDHESHELHEWIPGTTTKNGFVGFV